MRISMTSGVFGLSLFCYACEAPAPPEPQVNTVPPALLSHAELDAKLKARHAQNPESVWSQASEQELWSALTLGDFILSVHVQEDARPTLQALMAQGKLSLTANYPQLSRQDFQIADRDTFMKLRKTPGLSQMEPAAYPDPAKAHHYSAGLGCDNSPDIIHKDDLKWINPDARMPWNFEHHHIPQAWERAQGRGVTVGLIDTGSSDHQWAFSPSGWAAGQSAGRFIERQGTYVESLWHWVKRTDGPHDRCGHGTFMSSILAAPRDSTGEPVGVAYGANLIVYRASRDVFLDDYHEKKGVAQAIVQLADRSEVKVISMSMGYLFHVRNIADAIRYAHRKGKLIVTAAGTSFKATNGAGVIFPARMHETIAVTGLLDTPWIQACDECHYGAAVDFSMVVQRKNDAHRRSVSRGYRNQELAYVGGSSAATAMFSGIAALLWSKHPEWNKDQIIAKLQQSSDLYPRRDANYGYGRVDARAALD